MATHDNQVLVKRSFEECWSQGAVGRLNDLPAPDHVHRLPGRDLHDHSKLELVAGLRTAFPDVHFTIGDELVGQDKVVIRWIAHGTHPGNFFGLPPTGKPVEYTGMDIIRCPNGRIPSCGGNLTRLD